MGFVNEMDKTGNNVTIDRNSGLILQKTRGPSREGTYEFEFFINGDVVFFSGISREKLSSIAQAEGKRQYDMDWYFNILSIPQNLKGQEKQIIEGITHALEIRGWCGRPEKTHSVSVTFKPELLA